MTAGAVAPAAQAVTCAPGDERPTPGGKTRKGAGEVESKHRKRRGTGKSVRHPGREPPPLGRAARDRLLDAMLAHWVRHSEDCPPGMAEAVAAAIGGDEDAGVRWIVKMLRDMHRFGIMEIAIHHDSPAAGAPPSRCGCRPAPTGCIPPPSKHLPGWACPWRARRTRSRISRMGDSGNRTQTRITIREQGSRRSVPLAVHPRLWMLSAEGHGAGKGCQCRSG